MEEILSSGEYQLIKEPSFEIPNYDDNFYYIALVFKPFMIKSLKLYF